MPRPARGNTEVEWSRHNMMEDVREQSSPCVWASSDFCGSL